MDLDRFPFTKLLLDMADAEKLPLPGPAKHAYVSASIVNALSTSPPPAMVWFLYMILNQLIPIVLEWLKKKYGDTWAGEVHTAILSGQIPWAKPTAVRPRAPAAKKPPAAGEKGEAGAGGP